ncbi:MAG: hypothetical protein O2894_09805 [Planctomycetota bacterium]|nr:hypothetical protein [Planctomycetota bacterium]
MRPVALLALLALATCSHIAPERTPRPTLPRVAEISNHYDAPGPVPHPARVEPIARKATTEWWRVAIPPRVPADLAAVPHAADPIELLIGLPRPAGLSLPLVLLLPILNNTNLLMPEFGSGFVRQGYAVAILPRKDVGFDPQRSVHAAEQELRLLLMRQRQALDWLATDPRVDATRIGVFGVSAGAMLGLSLMAVDPRVRAGVFVFAGGPLADVMVDSEEGRVQRGLAEVRAARGMTNDDIRRVLRETVRTDPLVLAPHVPRDDILLFLATEDDSVPTHAQRALRAALGGPETREIRAGHYVGVGLFFPHILGEARAFLGQRLGSP